MTISTDSALALEDKCPCSLVIRTTLYDLIVAINAEVGAEEDDLVIACVVHLLKTQRLIYGGASAPQRLVTAHRPAPRRRKAGMTGRHRRTPRNALRSAYSRSYGSPRPWRPSIVGGRPRTSGTGGCESPWSPAVISYDDGETGQIGHKGERFSVETVRKTRRCRGWGRCTRWQPTTVAGAF